MLKILIVDDNADKCRALSTVISGDADCESFDIETAPDIATAKRLLRQHFFFDWMLLDLQLPNRFPDLPAPALGVDLLSALESGRYHVPGYITGVTEHQDELANLSPEARDKLWGVIGYDRTTSEWAEHVKRKLRYLSKVTDARGGSGKLHTSIRLGIICALEDVELDGLKLSSDSWQELETRQDAASYYKGSFRGAAGSIEFVAASPSQMGMTASCALATKLILQFCPELVCMTGIMAGVEGRVNIGDVVVADPCWDYGNGKFAVKDGKKVFQIDPRQERTDERLLKCVRRLKANQTELNGLKNRWPAEKPPSELAIRIGPVATGAAVLADSDRLAQVEAQNRKLLGIDMESYGVLFAARNSLEPTPPCISVKCVTDFADEEKRDTYQRYCAFISAQVLRSVAIDYFGAS